MKVKFSTPYALKEQEKKVWEELFNIISNQYLSFLMGCLFVYFHFQNNFIMSFICLVLGLIPLLTRVKIEINSKK